MSLISYPGDEEHKAEAVADPTALSKRAARRIFQRAFVLGARDRNVRQHIREAHCLILWVIEDWDLTWTVSLNRGIVEFDRRPTKRPDLTLTWRTADEFFKQAEITGRNDDGPERNGDVKLWKVAQPVYAGFCASLRELLLNPVDESGVRIA